MSDSTSQSKNVVENITSSSTPEELSSFFLNKFKFSKEVIDNIIKEEISGDILTSLEDEDFKSLDIKLGPKKKIQKYIKENKTNFEEKKIDVIISKASTKEEVNKFFDKYLGIKDDMNLDGKNLLELNKEDIRKMNLVLGKKKKLENYVKYFNSIKQEEEKEEKEKKEDKANIEEKEEKKEEKKDENEIIEINNEDKKEKDEIKNDMNEIKPNEEIEHKEEEPKIEIIDEKELIENRYKPLNLESKFNIFFMLSLTSNFNNEIFSIVASNGEKEEKCINYPLNIISDEETTALDEEKRRIVIVQVPSDEKIKKLVVKIVKKEKIIIKEDIVSDIKQEKEEKDKNEIILNEEKKEEKKDEEKGVSDEKKEEKEEKEITEEKKDEEKKEEKKEEENKEEEKKKEESKEEKKEEENKIEETSKENKEESNEIKENNDDKNDEKEKANKEQEGETKKEETKEPETKEKEKKEIKQIIKEKIIITEYICTLIINNELNNYFHFSNLTFENLTDNLVLEEKINSIYEKYLSYFLHEYIIPKKNYKKDIIQSLLYLISITNDEKNKQEIKLSFNNLFFIFKSCLEFKLKISNISIIKLIEEKINVDSKNILTSDELDDLYTLIEDKDKDKKENTIKKFASFIINFYSNNIEYKTLIKDFLDSKNIKYYIRDIFTLLIQEEIKLTDLDVLDNKIKIKKLKDKFIEVANTKEEINFILNKFSQGLIDYLQFISDKINLICKILEQNAEKIKKDKKQKKKEEYNYILNIPGPEKEDDIKQIGEIILKILNDMKNKKYTILNYEQIFNQLVDIYANETLDEFCNLKTFVDMLKTHLTNETIENYYIKIHQKGMNLIKMEEMNEVEEIIKFIYEKDIFYQDEKYINNENRDPLIFSYIPIGNKHPDYQNNIQILKDKQIWNLYNKSNANILNAFHQVFLNQINDIRDLESLLDLFSDDEINKQFIEDINIKFKDIIHTCFNEERDNHNKNNYLFQLFERILILNEKRKLDILEQIKLINLNFDDAFTSNYYLYLLQSEKVKNVIKKVNNYIINFFIDQHKKGKTTIDSLIFLLKVSPDESFRIELLNQMDNFLLDEKDFYQREETKKFKLFKFFNENFQDLIKQGGKKLKGKYLIKSVEIKNKINKDLNNGNVPYITIETLLQYEYRFLEKIKVIVDFNTNEANKVLNNIKSMVNKCLTKFNIFDKFIEYYSTFYRESKRDFIQLIKNKLNLTKEQNLINLVNLTADKYIIDENFSYNNCLKDNENLKYKYSIFFMPIYREKYENEHLEKTEDDIFNGSIKALKDTFTKIVNQKETKEPFFEINYVEIVLRVVQNNQNNNNILNKEIIFLVDELKDINKNAYIKNNLLPDITNFSHRNNVQNLISGMIYFIETFNKIKPIQISNFYNTLKSNYDIISKNSVTANEIQEIMKFLLKHEYDFSHGKTSLMEFYELMLGKEEAITFLKELQDKNMDIKTFNEFIDEQENSQLTTNDVDNLLDTFEFFKKLVENKNIVSDIALIENFKKSCEKEKNIMIKMKEYLKCYGELIELNKILVKNPEATAKKVEKILNSSEVEFYKNINDNNLYTFKIVYIYQKDVKKTIDVNELNELRYKIYMSGTGSNLQTEENKNKKEESKEVLTNKYVSLIDNINQLNNTLNSLIKSGYPFIKDFSLKIENANAFDSKDKSKTLEKIIEEYKLENKNFKKIIKKGYETSPILRLFYAYQFIQLHEQIMQNQNNEDNKFKEPDKKIKGLINYMLYNQISEYDIKLDIKKKSDSISNIHKYFELLLKENDVKLDKIYSINQVLITTDLTPGLYRYIKDTKEGNYSDLSVDLIYLYLNLTGNFPIVNTLLFCNEETKAEEVKAFLYRALYCDKPVLFVIANMEYLGLSDTQNALRTLKKIYKIKNKDIKSYVVFIYEKADSGLSRDLEKLISDKFILNRQFFKEPEKRSEKLDEIVVYSSVFSGYGKTTEIIHEVKDVHSGEYYYLPIGGTFNREYVIKNLKNLNFDTQNCKYIYLHLDLSDTEKDELMNEILFKLIILRYLDSSEEIFYLGHDINIIIEIPQGFFDFKKKFKILNLFKQEYIDKLRPLRIDRCPGLVGQSPIAIVGEVLKSYEEGKIARKNIDLELGFDADDVAKYEEIINKYFNVENQNYYQKMNFIKILSLQFQNFFQSIYFDYQIAFYNGIQDLISKARVSVIKNFIDLTKVFTRSPYDQLLIKRQKENIDIYNKYDHNAAIEKAITALENEKHEVFSFDDIKPSLVFFNRDKNSFSIISNANKNDEEYKGLLELWNSNNPDKIHKIPLIDYKNMTHEQFLDEIMKLFALDGISKDRLREICVKAGNYIFVCDNFIKIVRILLNIEAKIPVILMGETGVGKTKIFEMLSTLYGKGNLIWRKLEIHAGITDEDIVEFIETITKEDNELNQGKSINDRDLVWVFFDEINTCNSLGLITEIMCRHTYLGKKINDNFVFFGACNPYRVLNKKMRESGLVYYNTKEKSQLNNLVYSVNPLPHSLLNFVFDFGSLRKEDERKYIHNTIVSIIDSIKENKVIGDINEQEMTNLIQIIIDSIVECHDFIRDKYDKSSVSMREIRRFGIFFEYFIKYFNNPNFSDYKKMFQSQNMTLYLCYYLRLNEKEYRKDLAQILDKYYDKSTFLTLPEYEIKKITKQMMIEKNKGIALNRALRENLFTCFTCIINNVPLIIVGKPGTGKSLSFQILYNSMQGKYSENNLFKDKGKLYRFYYQGSETSTAEGIKQVFDKALATKNEKKEEDDDNKIIPLVFFDEMGLAERSSNNPLKVIHFLLEKDAKDSVPFLGISNWKLDAAKINRALGLTITDYDIQDLEETAISIAEALDEELAHKYGDFFNTLARTYYKYLQYNQEKRSDNKYFHGNRDFYNLIKNAMRELKVRRGEIEKNEKKNLTEVGILSLEINFGGLEDSALTIKNLFKEEFKHKFDENVKIEDEIDILDIIKKNIMDENSRYLMLISEGNSSSDILSYLLTKLNRKYILLVGSKYKADIKSGRYSEEILNKIKYIMETDDILLMQDLDMIYPSLYDLFNQNFTIMGNKQYARIAFEYAKISSEVNRNFHAIVLVNNLQIQQLKLDPPFLNRFEKHIINYNMLLEKDDLDIINKINDYIKLIANFNNKENLLRLDLGKLLINCKPHDIAGLVFKLKNIYPDIIKEKEKGIEQYEEFIVDSLFKKIVPTFCQDIIASIVHSKIEKFNKYNEKVFNIYKTSKYNNFESYFQKAQYKKNIIYTFSKMTETIFEEKKIYKNKFGEFSKQSATIIETIKSEAELLLALKSFSSNNNKNILVIKFGENDLDKINSINHVINTSAQENKKLLNKNILFIVHKKRQMKPDKKLAKNKNKIIANNKKEIIPDLIPFTNEEFNQIFIDNLKGSQNSDLFQVISQQQNDKIAKDYLKNSKLIERKIYSVLNYIKFDVLNETQEVNKNNYLGYLAEKILENEKIKSYIYKSMEKQANNMSAIINDIYTSDAIEVNDIDFFEVINSKLGNYLSSSLLKMIYQGLKNNILNQIIIGNNLEIFMKNEYFNNIILNYFTNTDFNIKLKTGINSNKITIYNGLQIPQSKSNLDKIITFVNETISQRYIDNENSLRKEIEGENDYDTFEEYKNQLEQFKSNILIELDNIEFFRVIYNQNDEKIKKLLLQDYLKYYIIKLLGTKQNTNYITNENIYYILLLIIKIKFGEEGRYDDYRFINDKEELAKIILFTQGYKNDILNLIDIMLEPKNYFPVEKYMFKTLNKNQIIFDEHNQKKRYIKKVNNFFYYIIESLIESMLVYSVELAKKDMNKFYDYFYTFTPAEASIQKLNMKYNINSKQIFNLNSIIKIHECYKFNQNKFEECYSKIINNLLKQTNLLYNNNYNTLYKEIIDLNKIFNDSFEEKGDEYTNLLFFIFRQEYQNINNEHIQIKLIQNIFGNESLIKKSYIFLVEAMKDMTPGIPEIYNKERDSEENLLRNFLNIDNNKKLYKYKELYKFLNTINSVKFNEILLYIFELQCQSYFKGILKMHNNEYSGVCCELLLLGLSIKYLKKCLQYIYENKNNNDNNILKIYSIAYIKTYLYYYVEVNYHHFDKCNFSEINQILVDKDENNKFIIFMRNIYIFRLYFQKFDNFEKFKEFDFSAKNIPIYQDIADLLRAEDKNAVDYIFKDSFISMNNYEQYKSFLQPVTLFLLDKENNINLNVDEINKNFDAFYCLLVNKVISYLYGNDKNTIINKMSCLYESIKDDINLNKEGKTLLNYLLKEDLLQNNIIKKISDEPLNQNDFQILLYILRFIFNTQLIKGENFYNQILKVNTSEFISKNYIPGSFPFMNEFIKSYNYLSTKFPMKELMGYYVCKDCGFAYEIRPCTFPVHTFNCPNGHVIGGVNHILSKKDFRIFNDQNDIDNFCRNRSQAYCSAFQAMSIADFKKNYVDKYLMIKEKGILENFTVEDFDKKGVVRNIKNITYRFLNFILYSYLLGSYILNHLSLEQMRKYLVDNLFPHTLFGIIKKDLEILEQELKNAGFNNIFVFLNTKFDVIIKLMSNLKSVDTPEKLDQFEKEMDNIFENLLNNPNEIEKLNKSYKDMNDKLLNFNPQSIKEIIQSNYPPNIYDQKIYPNIQYYTVSNITDMNNFIHKFNSSEENKKKYAIIDALINRDLDLTKNAMNMKSLISLNKLSNLLLNIYSYKITRQEAKKVTLIEELPKIVQMYNEINNVQITENDFKAEYITNFLSSWDLIKSKSVQYKCRVLRDLDKGQKPYEIKIENLLCDFLVDDGDKEGGMFLAAAYQYLIESQNTFINNIISKNNINGVLNSYVVQLEQEVHIQDATKNEIININEEIFDLFEKLVINNSMRNIFSEKKDEINYSNYNDIIYNYDIIEEELGKKILPGLKKFTNEKIKFITYLYEGFRGENSTVLKDYISKYNPKDLDEIEKDSLYNLLEENRNSRFYNDVFASLQILMNQIIKENYPKDILLYQIIEKLPKYVILEQKLVDFFNKQYTYYYDLKLFTVNSLIPIFDYFEALCWKDMKKNIPIDYQDDVPEHTKKYIIEYFEKNEKENKIINKENLTFAIRKLISRTIAVTRQEMEIQSTGNLKHYIINEDLWNKIVIETEGFENEIDEIFKNDVLVGQSYKLYLALNGDNILDNKLFKKKAKENEANNRKESYNIDIDEKGESDLAKTLGENKDEFEQQKSTEVHSESDEDKSDSEEEEDFRNDEI